ncbi:MAG: CHRD domain-containing protein [Deltaproteobacteria bacterium]|nr:MAG: CHRD domain-containing protein [Deltaproteobacteria bacterium]
MRRIVFTVSGIVALLAFVSSGSALANRMHGEKVKVKLGAVPGVKTSASGDAVFVLSKDGKTLHYKLNLKKIDNATMAHVHAVGDDGTPAAILTWIYPTGGTAPSLKEGSFSGTLAEGDITADKLAGPLKGGTLKDLFEKIEYGTAGVAVHTKQNGKGELWGLHKEAKAGKADKTEKKPSSGGSAPRY